MHGEGAGWVQNSSSSGANPQKQKIDDACYNTMWLTPSWQWARSALAHPPVVPAFFVPTSQVVVGEVSESGKPASHPSKKGMPIR